MQMVAEWGHHSYRLNPGPVYSVLHELEQAGYLTARWLALWKLPLGLARRGKGAGDTDLCSSIEGARREQTYTPFERTEAMGTFSSTWSLGQAIGDFAIPTLNIVTAWQKPGAPHQTSRMSLSGTGKA
ncbi:MAG TPA: PadR family transcriptional regulator [Gemmataceae bacterium]|nr:PadR family transcriptional regulator [Gemmataceae bacterium]